MLNTEQSLKTTDLEFELNEELLYKINENRRRLAILASIKQEIFKLVYDKTNYTDIYRCYIYIANILYISRLFKKLRQYVEHYLLC